MDVVDYIMGLDVPLHLPARYWREPVPEHLVRLAEEAGATPAEDGEMTGGEKPPEAEVAARTAARIANYIVLGAAAVREGDLDDLEGALRRLQGRERRAGRLRAGRAATR